MKDKEYVADLLDALQHHMESASTWDERVQDRVKNIKMLYARHTEEQMRKKFEVDYDLNDRLAKYRYHQGEVQRYSAMIQGFITAQTFLAR